MSESKEQKEIDAQMRDEGYIPVTNWLIAENKLVWLDREKVRIERQGIMCKIGENHNSKALYRKLRTGEKMIKQAYS